MVAYAAWLNQPAHCRKVAGGCIFDKIRIIGEVLFPLIRIADALNGIVGIPFVPILIEAGRVRFPGDILRAQEVAQGLKRKAWEDVLYLAI